MSNLAELDNNDLTDIRVEEAKLLQANALRSAQIVSVIIILIALLLFFSAGMNLTLIWLASTGTMVLVTILYAKYRLPQGINRSNVFDYLKGHLLVTALTGATWCAFAIYSVDPSSYLSVFITSFFLTTLTLGDMMPGAIYRPAYLTLASVILIPFGMYLILQEDIILKLMGLGFFSYFIFGFTISRRTDDTVAEGIKAAINRENIEKIYAQGKEIERLNEEKARFLAAISHDMSQPLLAQRNFIKSLKTYIDSPEHVELLQNIDAAQLMQEQLHQDLADFIQIGKSDIPVNKMRFDLKQNLEKLVLEFASAADARDIDLSFEVPATYVHTDPILLNRIVRNLLSNAIKFAPINGTVKISIAERNKETCIVISDNGPGIPIDQREQVFKEYVRLDNLTNASGLGLGLSIVKHLTKAIGAKVSLDSNSSGGTDAKLILPKGIPAAEGSYN